MEQEEALSFRPEFWLESSPSIFSRLRTTETGLSSHEAKHRLLHYNLQKPSRRTRPDWLALLVNQFRTPIIVGLLLTAVISSFFDVTNAVIILAIVFVSGILGFWQEHRAANAVEELLALVRVRADAFRDGKPSKIPLDDIVPGDVVLLNAGDVVPGDCITLESKDLFVDEAALTGETYPVEKTATSRSKSSALFMGTHVVSGDARALVVRTGSETEFGRISERLRLAPPETEFEGGIRRFGYFLMEVTLLLVFAIFAINAYMKRPILDSLLFSLALAVGLTPQLLPAIISVNLAQGTRHMAAKNVIVKRLASIENFGSMNVLCADKTGTLTEGAVRVRSAYDSEGRESERVLLYAYLNSHFETGFVNPIDAAIKTHLVRRFDVSGYSKLDEVPYDFVRKRLSILVSGQKGNLMVTKGAMESVLESCSRAEASNGRPMELGGPVLSGIKERFENFSRDGFRVLGVAYKDVGPSTAITKDDERGMTFLGFLVLYDPPKAHIAETVASLKALGVSLKMVTGDNRLVAASVGRVVGLSDSKIATGAELRHMSDDALRRRVNETDIFAEIEPNQKERIIMSLRQAGSVVGYLGDGINDASALHVADVGISVDSAADVAKDAADIVLLRKDLAVLLDGVREGRATFANTLKYIFMSTSANFGNMFSMAGASIFLPFLPLLPTQILITNLLTDLPEMTIAGDNVDTDIVERPRRLDIGFIRSFMIVFGIISSVFDYLTFGVLLLVLHSTAGQFRTGWFVESVVSAAMVVLVVRSRRPFFSSRPSRYLLAATLFTIAAAVVLPFTSLGVLVGFAPLPPSFILIMGAIVAFYMLAAEMAKAFFYGKVTS